jgi:hypothetical protein
MDYQRAVLIGDPPRGLHQGQRSDAPHQRAGPMTAPDHFAEVQLNILRRRGPATYDFCTRQLRADTDHSPDPDWTDRLNT